MARRSVWVQMQREAERRRREAERTARALQREQARRQREAARQQAYDEKEQKRLYLEQRTNEAEQLSDDIAEFVGELDDLLSSSLARDPTVAIEALKEKAATIEFEPGELAIPIEPPTLQLPPAPSAFAKLLPGAKTRHTREVGEVEATYNEALTEAVQAERNRQAAFAAAEREHQEAVRIEAERVAAQNEEVNAFKTRYGEQDPDAVVTYCSMVLAASRYPERFPQQHKVAYVPESRQLVIEMDLPTYDIVPEVLDYRYVKAKDETVPKARPTTQRRGLYANVVAQVTLRTMHEMFQADGPGHVESIVFNGHVNTIDPRTGQPTHPCLITLRSTRDLFDGLDLARVEPDACLRGLNASVSRNPAELAPVRPVLEFDMVDPRFVQETDVLSTIDERPNLMELTPGEFEALITNLFEKMGLETRMTQASRDGGVDCVAYDPRPIFGGKVVIQAKRYKNTVGVSAVRDLFGTMQNEGASKGILVTTSGYGKASFQFAENKPLELLSGSNLLYLLEKHAGTSAKIEPPEDWAQPEEQSAREAPVATEPLPDPRAEGS
ncbi:MAG TPA: restriction endonuclease [Solirubrobacteraceae bacterium]|jgi:restriction system protein|nr:restriction endonuclease [Solirubrobacteraceae bacterium]